MMANFNTQTTGNTGAGFNKTYYDRSLLEAAKTQLVYTEHGQKRPLPKNAGKKIEMRRWSLWDPSCAMTPLTEGETPDGLSLAQDIVEAEVKQYGAYFTYSDMLDLTGFDEILSAGSERMGELLGTVIEWVTRDEIATGNNVNWAGDAISRNTITVNDKLTSTDIRKAVRDLKKRKARMFLRDQRKHYVAVVSPDAVYDLQSDPLWQAANTYVDNDQLYTGELGRLFGVVFLESTEAPVVKNALSSTISAYSATTKVVTIDDELSEAAQDYLDSAGAQVTANGQSAYVAGFDAGSKSITLTAAFASAPATGAKIVSRDGADSGIAVHQTLVFGQDAYGIINVDEGSIRIIVKSVGEGGFDPLNQRGTVGGKVMAFAAKILNEDWITRIEHAVTED
ncbi:MAG: N4-gp56 family major capsid protein [Clostridiales bacterium]|jgi:N4-gp56 family major capsid protein|nr:N4-gp56 family major capsid protein [Clostridiales bacterium]